MFKNYLKTAFRNLVRRRNYTMINIAGLAAGIAICLVLFLVIRYEMSFDDYHQKKSRIYRVLTDERLRREMVHKGIARAGQFSWEQSVRRVRQIYGEVGGS